jgi:hypothetical protein
MLADRIATVKSLLLAPAVVYWVVAMRKMHAA